MPLNNPPVPKNLPAPTPGAPVELLNETATAEYLGWSVAALRKDRLGKRELPYTIIGARTVRYPLAGLRAYVAARVVGGDENTTAAILAATTAPTGATKAKKGAARFEGGVQQ